MKTIFDVISAIEKPERYGIYFSKRLLLLQIENENCSLIVCKNQVTNASKCITLFSGLLSDFMQKYCIKNYLPSYAILNYFNINENFLITSKI